MDDRADRSDAMNIHTYRCCSCRLDVDERTMTVWNKVVGWERRREKGGTNHIALRRKVDEYMCELCMDREQAGDAKGQMHMFATDPNTGA
jgi:hypothetical protein